MRTLAKILALSLLPLSGAWAQDSANGPRVAVPTHDIERGEIITAADLTIAAVEPQRMRPGIAMTAPELVGREARRLLHSGEPVRGDDVRMPILIVKGSTVTMTFEEPGIVLTATGRAMGDAGMGESVVVQNPVSFRQVTCIVTGQGQVRATNATPTAQVAINP